ncbi:undecaprenyl-diphosphate phosphatase [Thermanaerovibrio acidaminovorans]|uniref:Undecaprenyl-diphosphatase n=1 Tax=Thermanaerovibrio acidaminovorans (strain ATCC 49978 / DSM 6589 / Su883) TaxID=525903 RepID=D1B8W3_THEAS|nr:undecaprenyl-diphosphate phosphatase [Thermanaerovibrio acidaminovorans]ACZ18716.1 Bacitracin resistance protein BacA [Thermanaerovibrio acidaminovorans DSM 6589]
MSSTLSLIILGAVQGLAEFLPVSSSGHLALMQIFMGMKGPQMSLDLALHVATLLAVFAYFGRDMATLLQQFIRGFRSPEARRSDGWRYGWSILAGTAVTAALGIPLKPVVEMASQNSLWVGCGLVITGAVLILSRYVPQRDRRVGLLVGMMVGLAQGLAVMPGVSRSGMTIVAGLIMGLAPVEAFRFSFLLSVPAIVGATLLEWLDLEGAFMAYLPQGWVFGFATASLLGLASLVVLKRVSLFRAWWVFGAYCAVVGLGVVGFSLLGVY